MRDAASRIIGWLKSLPLREAAAHFSRLPRSVITLLWRRAGHAAFALRRTLVKSRSVLAAVGARLGNMATFAWARVAWAGVLSWRGIRRVLRIPTEDRLPNIPGGDPLVFGAVMGGALMLAALALSVQIDRSSQETAELQVAEMKPVGPLRPPARHMRPVERVAPVSADDLETGMAENWPLLPETVTEPAPVESAVANFADDSESSPNEAENIATALPLLTMPEASPDGPVINPPDVALLPVEPAPIPPVTEARPQWLANAVQPRRKGNGPMIAIVIDDAGLARERTARAIDLPAPLTIAFIPYSGNLEGQTRRAQRRGHELMLHIPMEPGGAVADPGPNALLTSMTGDELMHRLRWAMARFDGYVGVNNHMGSKFMARADLVEPLLAEMNDRGFLFLDSRTDHKTVGAELARGMGMPHASRDVFLDNDLDADKIAAQLKELERVARRKGHAIAIGHPHDITVDVLAEWIPKARARGFTLVPVSAIVKLEYGEEARLARVGIDRTHDRLHESALQREDRADSSVWRVAEGDSYQTGESAALASAAGRGEPDGFLGGPE